MKIKSSVLILFFLVAGIATNGKDKSKEDKKVNLAAIPIVNYNKTLGVNFGLLAQGFYKVNPLDTVSPSSSTGLFGMYTTNSSYLTAVFQRLYLNEDRWRIMAAVGLGNFNYQYWQDVPVAGGGFIGFTTGANFAFLRVERKVYKELYFGLNGILSKATSSFDIPDFFPDSLKNDNRSMNNFGYLINYDKREHQLNPYGGYNIEYKNYFYREWMNSSNDFNKYEITYNHYYRLGNERNILATRVHASIATGDVPFQGQSVVGQDDIRGYSNGKYRDNQVYAMQAEYRWRFYKKLGMVGFVGVASAVRHFNDIFSKELLPGAGVGFRYMMLEKERINVGLDVAKGKDDWGLYFRIGESFGR